MQGAATDLFLAGSREGPDPAAIDLAHDLVKSYKSLQTQIETHLFEHYRAYDPAIVGGEHVDPYPKILTASAVWPEVTLVYVSIAPLRGSPAAGSIIEIAYSVSWDEEHTVGARIQNGRLFELCGSV
jgi:hypothetical protein